MSKFIKSNENQCVIRFSMALFFDMTDTILRLTDNAAKIIEKFDELFLVKLFGYAFNHAQSVLKEHTLCDVYDFLEHWDIDLDNSWAEMATLIIEFPWV